MAFVFLAASLFLVFGARPAAAFNVVAQVSFGGNTVCALMSDQSAQCWGDNTCGQFGDGMTTARHGPKNVPTEAVELYEITQSVNVSAPVLAAFTFTVANQPSACNGESNFVSGAGSTSAIALGNLAVGANVSGTYASPAAISGGEQFGYTYHDATTSSSVTNPSAANFIALTNSSNAVMGSASSQSGSGCVGFDAQAGATTPPAAYTPTVIYTAVPAF